MIVEGQHYQVHRDEIESANVTSGEGWNGIDIRFLLSEHLTGSSACTLWRATFTPGASHARHTHDGTEVFFVMSGRGAAGTGDKEYEVGAGEALFVPPGAVHWFRNPSPDQTVEIVGVYTPGGSLKEAGYHYVGELTDEFRTVKF